MPEHNSAFLLEGKGKYRRHIKLKQELLANAQYKGSAIQIKNELQKQVLINKHYFAYYRWR